VPFAIVLGEEELSQGVVKIKEMGLRSVVAPRYLLPFLACFMSSYESSPTSLLCNMGQRLSNTLNTLI
jgi:histidyl-tRNA synthetase